MRSSISESDIASLPEMTTLSSAQRCGGMFVHPARRRRQRVTAKTDWREAGDIALRRSASRTLARHATTGPHAGTNPACGDGQMGVAERSEEHTSELQSRENLVCRLLLEKKKRFDFCR